MNETIIPRVRASDQFQMHQVTRLVPVRAFDAYMAVWFHHGKHTIVACPTLQDLKDVWIELAGVELIETAVQRVDVIKSEKPVREDLWP